MAHTKDRLSFLAFQNWQPYLARMVEQYPQVAAAHGSAQGAPTVQQALRQVEDLEGMDLVNQSTALLTALEAVTPGLRNEPAAQAIRERTGNMRLSMRVAAGIFTTVIVLTLVLALLGQMKVGLGIVLAILATIELVRGSISARGAALTLSLLTVVLNMIINAAAGSLIDAIIWGAFGVAMALLLAGHPGKARIFSALGIFILGFFTPMALALVVTLLGG